MFASVPRMRRIAVLGLSSGIGGIARFCLFGVGGSGLKLSEGGAAGCMGSTQPPGDEAATAGLSFHFVLRTEGFSTWWSGGLVGAMVLDRRGDVIGAGLWL
jgi:hypothetical protein